MGKNQVFFYPKILLVGLTTNRAVRTRIFVNCWNTFFKSSVHGYRAFGEILSVICDSGGSPPRFERSEFNK